MLSPVLPARHRLGFTLIELMVTIVILSILMALAFPSMSTWIRNSHVRAVADSLQNGLRLAQAEALRRSRQTVFSLTNSETPQNAASLRAEVNGRYWSLNTVQLMTDETAAFVESGILKSAAANVTITGPAALCFNSLGRLVGNPLTGVKDSTGSADVVCTAAPAVFVVNASGADRRLQVVVGLGGQVRMCDPNKPLATHPDGCS